jgi:3-deoxy-D-manno-octulosonate 8-phosphate phosphatase (KDO 8-P phosphatase)
MHDIMDTIINLARNIKLIIFDIDGVLTNGTLFLGDGGEEYKAFNSRDGHGMRMLIECGLQAAVITGRSSEVVRHRMRDLGIDMVFQGYRDKRPAFRELLDRTGLDPRQIAYMGDDVVDLPVMTQVGMAIAVSDAHPFVLRHADYVTEKPGGGGAAREAIETILQAQGMLQDKLSSYLE